MLVKTSRASLAHIGKRPTRTVFGFTINVGIFLLPMIGAHLPA